LAEQLNRVRQARPKTLLVVGLSVATIVGGAILTVPVNADPRPTLAEVQRQVDELHDLASEANERYNAAAETLTEIERQLTSAESDAKRQEARVKKLTADMGGFAAATYRAGGLDPTVQAMLADDPDDFLARSSVIDAFATQQAEQLIAVAAERQQLEQKRLLVDEERSRQAAIKAVLTAEKKSVDDLLAEQEELLAKLTAEEKARLAREREKARLAALAERDEAAQRISRGPSTGGGGSTDTTPAPNVPASGRAAIAVKAALSKIGAPYVYGTAGPDTFDCSGFTSWAWAQAGVSLSHSSRVQATQGTRVSVSQLQPGDILFYDSPVSHVAMYIGDGMVVHASNPRTDVTTAPMYQAGGSAKPFAGAMRPG
jgi:cell wall-associated NlpC family hydrolase